MSKTALLVVIRYQYDGELSLTSQQFIFDSRDAALAAQDSLERSYSQKTWFHITMNIIPGVA